MSLIEFQLNHRTPPSSWELPVAAGGDRSPAAKQQHVMHCFHFGMWYKVHCRGKALWLRMFFLLFFFNVLLITTLSDLPTGVQRFDISVSTRFTALCNPSPQCCHNVIFYAVHWSKVVKIHNSIINRYFNLKDFRIIKHNNIEYIY